MRIVSAVPSLTELLVALNLDEEIAGITKFCIHPASKVNRYPRIGGTKTLKLEKILSLQPDLVIANKEENTKEQIEYLQQHCNVYLSDISTFEQALSSIRQIGNLTGTAVRADELVDDIQEQHARFKAPPFPSDTLYLIWYRPWMAAGADTFISDMMHLGGWKNMMHARRYPVLENQTLIDLQPQTVLLSSEPYPFREFHKHQLQVLLPDADIRLVNGEYFSWYGSRIKDSFPYFTSLHESRS